MDILAIVIFLLLSLTGLLVIPAGIPGTFIVVAASGFTGLMTGWELVRPSLLLIFLGLAIFGEVGDYLFSIASGKKYGASKYSLVGSFIGAVAGSILGLPLPVIGNLLGAFLGAFVGAFITEFILGSDTLQATRSGMGVLFGKIFGSIVKVAIGMGMIVKVMINFL
ncbi:MAG: DUF456 domain-containing protein [Candidatus Bipolaricaulota bacterium]|nr:DUF456 domain-containing protein [Candidatus Bipolaricaulota bacterium]MBS3791035.1 DUF456 domain-containing protein [Candidatus Bipolaricaulota bacterium]